MNEVVHVGEGKVHRTEPTEDGHNRDSNDADPRHALLDRENSPVDAEEGERIADAPEAIEIAEPEDDGQRRWVTIWNWNENSQKFAYNFLVFLTNPNVADQRMSDVIWNHRDDHHKNRDQRESPVEESRLERNHENLSKLSRQLDVFAYRRS